MNPEPVIGVQLFISDDEDGEASKQKKQKIISNIKW